MEPQDWLHTVAAAHASGAEIWTEGKVAAHRVYGGANNALYHVHLDGQELACKLCVADGRRRAAREYGVLCLLQAVDVDIAAQPLLLDESCSVLPFPTVVYRWLPGQTLGPLLTEEQLGALLESVQQAHALRQDSFADARLPAAWFHWFEFRPYLTELGEFLARYGGWLAAHEPDGADLQERLVRLVNRCAQVLSATGADPSCGRFPLCLCRVDANLANAIWSAEGTLRWVDWEYSGWGDPALDLADLSWHVALEKAGEAQRAWLRDSYVRPADDPGFEARLAAWDRLLLTRWPLLILRALWTAHNGPDRVRLTQSQASPTELRARLVRTIERAERFRDG
jgi:aminoglycoside phosphotransferase (APT) family kinase protein